MTALINTFRSKQSDLSNIISSTIKGSFIDNIFGTLPKLINDGVDIKEQIKKLEEITAKALRQIKNTINNLHAQDASARSTLKNYLDQINLTNQDQIIARLEELGILVGQKVVKANIPSDPRDMTGLGLSLNKLYDLKAKLNQIADAYSADYTEHFKGIRNQCDELLGDYCTGQTRIIGSKITGEVMGLAKNFALSRIEKKAAEKAKEATELQRKAEFEKQAQQKAIDETDPWHQYREQSEKMNRIRTQTQHRKQSAVHDAKNQTVVLDTSSHNDGPPDFDKTFWAKITTKSNDNTHNTAPVNQKVDPQFRQSFNQVQHDDMGASFGGGYTPPADDKKSYDLGNLKTLDDYLSDPFQTESNPIFSITTPDKKVYTLVPYANAAASPNMTYTDLSLIGETGLGLAIRYGVPVARTLAPYAAKGFGIVGTALLAKEAAEFAWEGAKAINTIYFDSPSTATLPPAAVPTFTKDDIRSEKQTNKDLIYLMAVSDMTSDKCWYIKQLPNPQKVQIWVNMADKAGNYYLNDSLYPSANVQGIIKHKALSEIYQEYERVCKDYPFFSEKYFLNGKELNKEFIGLFGGAKGSTRADLVTKNTANLGQGPKQHYNAKFGRQGITDTETKAHIKNLPSNTEFYEVKPGFNGVKRIL